MMAMLGSSVAQVVDSLLATESWKATKYLSDQTIVRATRKRDRRGKFDNRSRGIDIIVTVGRPNYLERKFLKDCRKAGEPVPVKKVQLKSLPKRRG